MAFVRPQVWRNILGHSQVARRLLVSQAAVKNDPKASELVDPEWATARPYKEIPGPTFLQAVKQFSQGGRYADIGPLELHKRLRDDYGDIVCMRGTLGRNDIIMTFRPEDFEKVFRTEGHWPMRRGFESFAYYRQKIRPEVFGEGGLLTEHGEGWQKIRSIVNPVIMQPKTVKLYVDKVDEVAREFMTIVSNLRDSKNELPRDFDQWLNRWALETIGVLALDTRLGVLEAKESEEAKHMIALVRDVFALTYKLDVELSFWKYFKTPSFKKLMGVFEDLTTVIMSKIDDAMLRLEKTPSDSENQSVLEKLLKIDKHIAVIMSFDMLFAGIDTTSSGMTGILYCLANNPEKQAKLREELRTIMPKKDTPLTPESMRNLPYLRACIKESLRLYQPISGNMRATSRDIVLQGYRIPKDTDVAMGSALMQRAEQHFKRSGEYLPERWLTERPDEVPNAKDANPFIFLPFGFGARSCIGKRLAMMEMEIVTARLVRQFEMRWNYGELTFRTALINTAKNPLQFELKEVAE